MRTNWKEIWVGCFEVFAIFAAFIYCTASPEERRPLVIVAILLTLAAIFGVSVLISSGIDSVREAKTEPPVSEVAPGAPGFLAKLNPRATPRSVLRRVIHAWMMVAAMWGVMLTFDSDVHLRRTLFLLLMGVTGISAAAREWQVPSKHAEEPPG